MKFCCVIAGSCVLACVSPKLRAADSPDAYAAITLRNPFGLRPRTAADTGANSAATPQKPLPPIALTGIATLASKRWACFTVGLAGNKARSCKLAVGQSDGDLELLSVDPAAGSAEIKFSGQPLRLALKGSDASRAIAARLQDQLDMEEHGRATEAYQKRELARQLKELADAGLAPKQ